jgi:hypothetical protein
MRSLTLVYAHYLLAVIGIRILHAGRRIAMLMHDVPLSMCITASFTLNEISRLIVARSYRISTAVGEFLGLCIRDINWNYGTAKIVGEYSFPQERG